jgi:hypothetical protein
MRMPSWTLAALRRQGREATERNAATYALAVDTATVAGIAARMEGRANLCGEVGAIRVEAGEDVGSAALNILST